MKPWESQFWRLVQKEGVGADIRFCEHVLDLITSATATAFDEGKSYWEPSEHHKDVWRNEGAEKAMKQRDAEVDAAYEKGKADQREEIFVWLASQPRTGLLVTEFSIKFPLINYGK